MKHPWLYISNNHLEGSWNGGWSTSLDASELLPAPKDISNAAAGHAGAAGKLGVILDDTLMHPLRVSLEEKPKASERTRFIHWKLKRYLPFSVEQAEVRWLPLEDGDNETYQTFSLPRVWPNRLHEGLADVGLQAGYVGGLYSTLLENSKAFQGRRSIALFDQFYFSAELDGAGRYLDFRGRRLPDDAQGGVDVQTLIRDDFAEILGGAEHAVRVCDFSNDGQGAHIVQTLSQLGHPVENLTSGGSVLERFMICLKGGS